jgi:hypothetical protein
VRQSKKPDAAFVLRRLDAMLIPSLCLSPHGCTVCLDAAACVALTSLSSLLHLPAGAIAGLSCDKTSACRLLASLGVHVLFWKKCMLHALTMVPLALFVMLDAALRL